MDPGGRRRQRPAAPRRSGSTSSARRSTRSPTTPGRSSRSTTWRGTLATRRWRACSGLREEAVHQRLSRARVPAPRRRAGAARCGALGEGRARGGLHGGGPGLAPRERPARWGPTAGPRRGGFQRCRRKGGAGRGGYRGGAGHPRGPVAARRAVAAEPGSRAGRGPSPSPGRGPRLAGQRSLLAPPSPDAAAPVRGQPGGAGHGVRERSGGGRRASGCTAASRWNPESGSSGLAGWWRSRSRPGPDGRAAVSARSPARTSSLPVAAGFAAGAGRGRPAVGPEADDPRSRLARLPARRRSPGRTVVPRSPGEPVPLAHALARERESTARVRASTGAARWRSGSGTVGGSGWGGSPWAVSRPGSLPARRRGARTRAGRRSASVAVPRAVRRSRWCWESAGVLEGRRRPGRRPPGRGRGGAPHGRAGSSLSVTSGAPGRVRRRGPPAGQLPGSSAVRGAGHAGAVAGPVAGRRGRAPW